MAYQRINFENKPSKKSPISAENLNHMEQGISDAHVSIADIEAYKANSIICTAKGKTILTTDSANVPLKNIRLYGKSIQNGTPTSQEQIPIESVENAEIKLYGKNLYDKDSDFANCFYNETSNIITSGGGFKSRFVNVDGISNVNISIKSTLKSDNLFWALVDGNTVGSNVINSGSIAFGSNSNVDVSNGKYLMISVWNDEYEPQIIDAVQIELGSVATEYEPYKQPQTLSLNNIILSGIPVSSGGNYTDENGQQYIADYVEFDSHGNGKLYKYSYEIIVDGNEAIYSGDSFKGFYINKIIPEKWLNRPYISNAFKYISNDGVEGLWLGQGNDILYFHNSRFYDESLDDRGLANFKSYLVEHPVTILTYLSTPTITDLTQEQVKHSLNFTQTIQQRLLQTVMVRIWKWSMCVIPRSILNKTMYRKKHIGSMKTVLLS